jgi:ABC-type uncharacterized transport system.
MNNNINNSTEKKSVGSILKSNKFKRGGMATIMTVIFIVLVIALNILVSLLSARFPSMNIDMTAQKLNTLSDSALDTAKNVANDTEVYVIAKEDDARNDRIFSDINFSQVSNLLDKMAEANPKIKISYIDADTNPQFMSEHANENLSTGSVMISTAQRSKTLRITDLFSASQDQNTGAMSYFSNVDSALANAVTMVNLENIPVVSVVSGHEGNRIPSPDFNTLLSTSSYSIQNVNLLTGEISADTQVLVIATPSTDYTSEEIQKLRDFLSDSDDAANRTVFVTCYPAQPKLPNLAGFLEEWGVAVEEGVVVETNDTRFFLTYVDNIIVDSAGVVLAENSYPLLVAPSSSPLQILFTSNADISVKPLWKTSANAYTVIDESLKNPDTSEQIVATLSEKTINVGGMPTTRNVVVFGSTLALTSPYITSSTFSNPNYTIDLFSYLTGAEKNNNAIAPNQIQTNTVDISASGATIINLGLFVFTIGIPLVILIAGLIVFLKRRHL